ncbi:ABC transporter permease subunit [Halobacillus litoralis]|uniref:ABC transporter permease subunit n=1 Tax=Halobacillus litoralis TaxID=45668 RepID=UPI001CD2DB82|nr:ABC transporter permease subunit [Halobacillus litoralis]MCA0971069.1 ABC transporter permease subunit [Halobacillus litoralis]
MKIIRFLSYYVLGVIGILLISTSPALFREGSFFNVSSYFSELQMLVGSILNPSEWVYFFKGNPVPLFEHLWEPYRYSMIVFFAGIILAVVVAFILAFGTMFLPKWAKSVVERVLNLLESIPDLLLAFCLQLFIVWLYKQTEILFVDFAAVGSEKIYGLPIIAVSVLPMIMLYKVILMLMEDEVSRSYVQMARSKGLEKSVILNVHVLRNIMKSVFYHSKIIIWVSLSSLFIFEYIFNMNGITTAFFNDFRPIVTTAIMLLLFTPFFIIYQGTEVFVFKDDDASDHINWKMNTFVGSGYSKGQGNKSFKEIMGEVGAHFKNVKFLIGFLVITTMLSISLVYTFTADPLVDQFFHIYEDNKLVSAAPHSPEFVFLGTTELGFSIFDQLLVGAKYTILFALAVAFMRMIIGFILAVPFAFFLPSKLQKGMEKLIDGMHFLPLTLIAYVLLSPVLLMPMGGFTTTEFERILYQGIIMTILVVPLVTILFGNEMKLLMKEEFVMSTKVMGGSSVHLIRKHLLPHLSSRMGVVFGQQFIQTLLLMIHLGVFNLYFGGTKKTFAPFQNDPPTSTTFEWSGLIGASKDSLMTGRWWYIIPALVCFVILIVSMQLIISGIKEVQQVRVGVPIERTNWWRKLLQNRKAKRYRPSWEPEPEDFVFTHEPDIERRKQG